MTAQEAMLNKAKRYHANQLEDAVFNKQLRIDAKITTKFDWVKYFVATAYQILG